MRVTFLLLSVTLMASCVSAPPYTPPTDGPIAKLIIPSSTSSYRFIGGVTSRNLRFAVDNGNNCSIFGKPVIAKDGAQATEIKIPGNKTIFVKTEYSFGNSTCTPSVSFESEIDKVYTVIPTHHGKYCSLSIFTEADNKEPIPVKLETAYVDSWSGLKVCTDKKNI
ncbi:hypothetical protein [Microbulbifer variabilis]|uniref:hypothetical protein n=1 Tax=Microbulbifer variabilis TaxID=266805 RepID=UPI001CFD919D|nr:hypothetical protein [Microbulbifer variabilis]